MSYVTWIEHQRITILKHFPPCTLILSVSRVLPTRNTISDSIWKLCHYLCHSSSKGAFEHWAYRLHTAKLYPMSSAAIQGHSGQQATAGTSSLALLQMLHLELHSTLSDYSAQPSDQLHYHCCFRGIPAARNCSGPRPPVASALLVPEVTLEHRGYKLASNILVKILLFFLHQQPVVVLEYWQQLRAPDRNIPGCNYN